MIILNIAAITIGVLTFTATYIITRSLIVFMLDPWFGPGRTRPDKLG